MALLGDMRQVDRQTIADVDARVQFIPLVEQQSLLDAGLEVELVAQDAAADAPVTMMRSPGRAPARRSGPRPVTRPSSVMLNTSGPSQLFVSPPAMARLYCSAKGSNPSYNSTASSIPPFLGSAKAMTAAKGELAIAARSLKFTASAFRPTRRGAMWANSKST